MGSHVSTVVEIEEEFEFIDTVDRGFRQRDGGDGEVLLDSKRYKDIRYNGHWTPLRRIRSLPGDAPLRNYVERKTRSISDFRSAKANVPWKRRKSKIYVVEEDSDEDNQSGKQSHAVTERKGNGRSKSIPSQASDWYIDNPLMHADQRIHDILDCIGFRPPSPFHTTQLLKLLLQHCGPAGSEHYPHIDYFVIRIIESIRSRTSSSHPCKYCEGRNGRQERSVEKKRSNQSRFRDTEYGKREQLNSSIQPSVLNDCHEQCLYCTLHGTTDNQGDCILAQACNAESLEVVSYLLHEHREKLEINARNKHGQTPLHVTLIGIYGEFRHSIRESLPFVELLLLHGADVNSTDNRGCTPLHYAALAGDAHVALLLLLCRVDLHVRDTKNRRALDYAVKLGHTNCFRVLAWDTAWWRVRKQVQNFSIAPTLPAIPSLDQMREWRNQVAVSGEEEEVPCKRRMHANHKQESKVKRSTENDKNGTKDNETVRRSLQRVQRFCDLHFLQSVNNVTTTNNSKLRRLLQTVIKQAPTPTVDKLTLSSPKS